MRSILSLFVLAVVVGCSASGGPELVEQAATACSLVQSEIYNGANLIEWAQGLEGCSGDVAWEIESQNADGSWSVWRKDSTHYDDNVVSHSEDSLEVPCVVRVHARFGDQEQRTREARNYNCSAR